MLNTVWPPDLGKRQGRRPIQEVSMSREVMAQMSRSVGVPPAWTSVLAVIAHPDEASPGLGAILDAFVIAGVKVEVLCLTHGQAWTCLLYTSDAADDLTRVDLGGRRIIQKKKKSTIP